MPCPMSASDVGVPNVPKNTGPVVVSALDLGTDWLAFECPGSLRAQFSVKPPQTATVRVAHLHQVLRPPLLCGRSQ